MIGAFSSFSLLWEPAGSLVREPAALAPHVPAAMPPVRAPAGVSNSPEHASHADRGSGTAVLCTMPEEPACR